MSGRIHIAEWMGGARLARVAGLVGGLALAGGLAGCGHKAKAPALPQIALAPVALETAPPPANPPKIAEVPPPELGPLPEQPIAPPPPRRRAAPPPAPPPVQVASAPEPGIAAIGALTTGGDDAGQSQQQARDLIGSIAKRIAALPAKTADAQKRQIAQVKRFLDQAQRALNSGDAEGAKNLATKAKLLMDDLEKR